MKKNKKIIISVAAGVAAIGVAACIILLFAKGNNVSEADEDTYYSASVSYETGDVFSFGKKDGNYIGWRVLSEKDDGFLLISDKVLDYMPYNVEYLNVTWEDSSLREYLNGTFYEDNFSESEKEHIELSLISNAGNSEYGSIVGNDTLDYFYLLSMEEAEEYFETDEDRRAVYLSDGSAAYWWLRTPGQYNTTASLVLAVGIIKESGMDVDIERGVRPVFYFKS